MALVISDVLFLIARSVGWWVKYGCASSNTSKATVVEQFQKKHEIVGLTLVRARTYREGTGSNAINRPVGYFHFLCPAVPVLVWLWGIYPNDKPTGYFLNGLGSLP